AQRGRGAHHDGGARVRDDGLADRTKRVLLVLATGRAERDRVMLPELLADHLGGIAGTRDESIDALVERALSEQLIEGRRAAPGGPDMEERDPPAPRASPSQPGLRR